METHKQIKAIQTYKIQT